MSNNIIQAFLNASEEAIGNSCVDIENVDQHDGARSLKRKAKPKENLNIHPLSQGVDFDLFTEAFNKKKLELKLRETTVFKIPPPPRRYSKRVMNMNLAKLNETCGVLPTVDSCHGEVNSIRLSIAANEFTNQEFIDDKQENMQFRNELRERISKLEETLAAFKLKKDALPNEKLQTDVEPGEMDEPISQKLHKTELVNSQMIANIKEMSAERDSLIKQVGSLEYQLSSNSEKSSQQISQLESEISHQQQLNRQLQDEIKKIQSSHEQAMKMKHEEFSVMRTELSSQLQSIESEKNVIKEAMEMASDQIVNLQDEVVRLKSNVHSMEQARAETDRELSWLKLQNEKYTQDQLVIEQLRMQLIQSENEAKNFRVQNEKILENHNVEIAILRQQIADLEAMRSQASQKHRDDQVILHNEIIKLKELLAERESQIQQKTIQLQKVSISNIPVQAVNDSFANLMLVSPSTSQATEENATFSTMRPTSTGEEKLKNKIHAKQFKNTPTNMDLSKVKQLKLVSLYFNDVCLEVLLNGQCLQPACKTPNHNPPDEKAFLARLKTLSEKAADELLEFLQTFSEARRIPYLEALITKLAKGKGKTVLTKIAKYLASSPGSFDATDTMIEILMNNGWSLLEATSLVVQTNI